MWIRGGKKEADPQNMDPWGKKEEDPQIWIRGVKKDADPHIWIRGAMKKDSDPRGNNKIWISRSGSKGY